MHSLKNVDILFCVCHLIQDSFLCSQYGGLVNNWAGSQNVLFRLDGTQHLLQKNHFYLHLMNFKIILFKKFPNITAWRLKEDMVILKIISFLNKSGQFY